MIFLRQMQVSNQIVHSVASSKHYKFERHKKSQILKICSKCDLAVIDMEINLDKFNIFFISPFNEMVLFVYINTKVKTTLLIKSSKKVTTSTKLKNTDTSTKNKQCTIMSCHSLRQVIFLISGRILRTLSCTCRKTDDTGWWHTLL